MALSGFQWLGLVLGNKEVSRLGARSSVEIDGFRAVFAKPLYEVRFARVRASAQASQLVLSNLVVGPAVAEEEFFAARDFRRPLLRTEVPECRISGIAVSDALDLKAFRVKEIEIKNGRLGALINRDKPRNTHPPAPILWNEFLNEIPQPLEIKRLSVVDGTVVIAQRRRVGDRPGVLTIDGVEMAFNNIANEGPPGSRMSLQGRGKLMNTSALTLHMEMPVRSPTLSLRYSATLDRMDFASLNPFFEGASYVRFKSGVVESASFASDVRSGHALGSFHGLYQDLSVAFLNPDTREETGVVNRLKSIVADHLALRTSNPEGPSRPPKVGRIDYTRSPIEKVLPFLWYAVRNGMNDILGVDLGEPQLRPQFNVPEPGKNAPSPRELTDRSQKTRPQ